MLRTIYFVNWLAIGVLALFVILLLLEPKKGGDAATRGLGSTFLYFGLSALVIMLILNLLPWSWTKYAAFLLFFGSLSLVLLPLVWPDWTAHQRAAKARAEAAKPIFDDPNLERLARLIEAGEPADLQARLASSPPEAVRSKSLLEYAIQEASSSSFRPAEKLQCVKALVDAGAPFASVLKASTPVHSTASNTGNPAMLRFLFEHGVDPNTLDPHFNRPYIFDAVQSSMDPLAAVQVFLEFGADPNAKAVFDDEDGPITPLIRAAQFDKWTLCAALIEKGAHADFKTPNGKSLSSYMENAADGIERYGSPETKADFARLRALLANPGVVRRAPARE